jgi:Helicase conserved C-terminal domain
MPLYSTTDRLNTQQAFEKLYLNNLRPLARLISDAPPNHKPELVELLTQTMRDEPRVRALYERLDPISQAAVREAAHDPEGELQISRFEAKYGQRPAYETGGSPSVLRLFFPAYATLPVDLKELLATFVPRPLPATLTFTHELPETVEPEHVPWHLRRKAVVEDRHVPLRVQETERAALHDVHAVLRLVDAGKVSVSATTKRPGQASIQAVAAVLHSGDFYQGDEDDFADDRSGAYIKAFAWPMIVQAAGFARLAGSKLALAPAGRKAAEQPPHEAIRTAWNKWLRTALLDELNRVSAIKGQTGKGKYQLTAVSGRRQAILGALAECPVDVWIAIDELFRFMRAADHAFLVTRDPWTLSIGEASYGSLGYEGKHEWELLQGRYTMAFLFEYAATMGLLDVAYISPVNARDDFRDQWGVGDLEYLSRYDGLRYVRINPLGAWLLGKSERYTPRLAAVEPTLKVLPNREVVVTGRPLAPGDALFLDRFAERVSDAVWRLSEARCLSAVEDGLSLTGLAEFLRAQSGAHGGRPVDLPQTVDVFLSDLRDRASRLRDLGAARLIECRDPELALLLANDRRLRPLCQIAGDRCLVFRAADEPAVRRALRELGYTVPPA